MTDYGFNEAGATTAPETCRPALFSLTIFTSFNEAGATTAPETIETARSMTAVQWASMRPGQQPPRKRYSITLLFASFAASMRPGQQPPRKPAANGSRFGPSGCFNEAGATTAPETGGSTPARRGSLSGFNEAGATTAPETNRVKAIESRSRGLQ